MSCTAGEGLHLSTIFSAFGEERVTSDVPFCLMLQAEGVVPAVLEHCWHRAIIMRGSDHSGPIVTIPAALRLEGSQCKAGKIASRSKRRPVHLSGPPSWLFESVTAQDYEPQGSENIIFAAIADRTVSAYCSHAANHE